ncbi:alpha/beta fold hydrolase [Mycolicibacterium mucogenicum]|uniref:alpha/beta fold hydrolase n=1 Tax=Mycolicibacterium mucogenicum TaxID=56689 RepID=UPI000769CD90|nr:alpha/beta hydrolase [Mycolicibacterium mucogenicum]
MTDSTIRTRHVQALGLRTRVLEVGPADTDEAVVFIHGGGKSADDWTGVMPRLGTFARGVAFDLPGFGHADKPAGWSGYNAPGWATFTAAALDRLGVQRAHLVLHDAGGEAGLLWALAHPRQLASVVLINSGNLIGYRWHLLARMHRVPVLGFLIALGGRIGLASVLRFYEPRLPSTAVARWRDEFRWGARRSLLRFYRATAAPGGVRLADELKALHRPVLIIWGSENRFVPAEQAQRQRDSFPAAEIVVVEKTGHYTHLEAPDQVCELMVPFLRSQM